MKLFLKKLIHQLQKKCDAGWYPPLIGLLALIDNFTLLIPTDGLLVSSTLLRPKRWIRFSLAIAIGSSLGGILLAILVDYQGMALIQQYFPTWPQTSIWLWTEGFFNKYGLLVIFLIAATPLTQQPGVILAVLAGKSLVLISVALFLGRLLKYIFMGYISSYAPHLLKKLWGLGSEIEATRPPSI